MNTEPFGYYGFGYRQDRSDMETERQLFTGESDAHIHVRLNKWEPWEDQAVMIRLRLMDGMFDAKVEEGDEGRIDLTLFARERADGEIHMLANALRWLAERLLSDSAVPLDEWNRMLEEEGVDASCSCPQRPQVADDF